MRWFNSANGLIILRNDMPYNSNFVAVPSHPLDIHQVRWTHDEQNQKYRSPFSKDRDRILYSNSFLRLRGKTQIFMLHKNDYIRTRLTHTLEVAQIAKTIGKALGLNLELIEAIAFGHDVGHTPFGHVGERTLEDIIKEDKKILDANKGFKHNLQALRLFCELEKGADFPNSMGLNLTKYTLWGIAHHSSIKAHVDQNDKLIHPIETDHPIYDRYLNGIDAYWSFEGYVVAIADEIAQRHHDIEDGLLYGIINRKELLNQVKKFQTLFGRYEKKCMKRLQNEIWNLEVPVFNALFARLVVNLYVTNVIDNTKMNIKQFEEEFDIARLQDFYAQKQNIAKDRHKNIVSMSTNLSRCDSVFQEFLKEQILSSYQVQAMDGKAKYIVRKLYEAFTNNPDQLPDTSLFSYAQLQGLGHTISRADILNHKTDNVELMHRCIVDYIGGMTDQFAYDEFDRLYGTRI